MTDMTFYQCYESIRNYQDIVFLNVTLFLFSRLVPDLWFAPYISVYFDNRFHNGTSLLPIRTTASKSIFDFLQQGMPSASPSYILHYYFSHFGFYLSFAFSPFSNLSALITSSFTPQSFITVLTGVANMGVVESNWSTSSWEWSERKS